MSDLAFHLAWGRIFLVFFSCVPQTNWPMDFWTTLCLPILFFYGYAKIADARLCYGMLLAFKWLCRVKLMWSIFTHKPPSQSYIVFPWDLLCSLVILKHRRHLVRNCLSSFMLSHSFTRFLAGTNLETECIKKLESEMVSMLDFSIRSESYCDTWSNNM